MKDVSPLPRYALAFVFLWILPGLAWARLLPSGTAGIAGFQPACGRGGRGPTFPGLTSFERLIVGLGLSEPTPADSRWKITFKIQDVPQDRLFDAIQPVVDEILDVRET